ncbi:MAG: hypothetical protein ACXV8U_23460 [Methylobacter sp.]
MKKKLIVTVACMQIIGCASFKYPGWEQVRIERSVYKQACEWKNEESCINEDNCVDWYKKRATIYGANIVVRGSYTETNADASYFYCAPGIPKFTAQPKLVWIIRNKFNKASTQLDLDKAVAECDYESDKATVDTSRKMPTRIYMPTNNFNYNISQIGAMNRDDMNERMHDLKLELDRSNLYHKCLQSKGFVSTRLSDNKSLADRDKYCPDEDNLITPCFISAE